MEKHAGSAFSRMTVASLGSLRRAFSRCQSTWLRVRIHADALPLSALEVERLRVLSPAAANDQPARLDVPPIPTPIAARLDYTVRAQHHLPRVLDLFALCFVTA